MYTYLPLLVALAPYIITAIPVPHANPLSQAGPSSSTYLAVNEQNNPEDDPETTPKQNTYPTFPIPGTWPPHGTTPQTPPVEPPGPDWEVSGKKTDTSWTGKDREIIGPDGEILPIDNSDDWIKNMLYGLPGWLFQGGGEGARN